MVSWENDGDNYKTTSKTIETKEAAFAICDVLINLLTSCEYEKNGGVANQYSIDSEKDYTFGVVYTYMKSIPYFKIKLLEIQNMYYTDLLEADDILESNNDKYIKNVLVYFMGIIRKFVGVGDFDIIVVDSISVTYSPEDIFLEEIFKFNKSVL